MPDIDDDTLGPLPAPSPYARLRKPLFALGMLVIFLLVFGQVLPRLFPASHTETNSTDPVIRHETIGSARERLDQLEAKVKALEDAPRTSDGKASDTRLDDMQSKIDAMQQLQHPAENTAETDRMGHLESLLAQQNDTVQALKTQLGELQSRQRNQLSALTAFGPLKDDALHGASYATDLATLRTLVQDNPKALGLLQQLSAHAEKGVITLPVLQSQFETAADALLSAHAGAVSRQLQSLIRIRKTGERSGDDDEDVLARAESRLNRGEVEAALQQLAALHPDAEQAMAEWAASAQDYVHARQLVDALQLALTQEKPAEEIPESSFVQP
jgi:hypothetical protein